MDTRDAQPTLAKAAAPPLLRAEMAARDLSAPRAALRRPDFAASPGSGSSPLFQAPRGFRCGRLPALMEGATPAPVSGDSWSVSAGRSGTGPYEEKVTASASAVGAAHLGRPPWRHLPPCGRPPVTSPPRSPPPGAPSGPAPERGGSYSGCPPAFYSPRSRAPPGSRRGRRTGPA